MHLLMPKSRRWLRRVGTMALAACAILAIGCEPSCEDTCEKLLGCDGVDSPRVSERECQRACTTQEELYLSWDDVALQEAFSDHKRCIDEEECEAIAEGVCYDERLFAFPADNG
ncbi:MAG: hypothetical protein VX265_02375 [Myxococcota bacterium]|nr:hypothetical protein [Myxococcota bacterium]MEC8424321.1 hypothetical protein [Myxococcota bacterium]